MHNDYRRKKVYSFCNLQDTEKVRNVIDCPGKREKLTILFIMNIPGYYESS